MKKKRPAKKASRKSQTPQTTAQKKPQGAKTPAADAKTPAQLPCAGHTQPRTSAQAKAAALAMRQALDKEEAGTPAVRQTPSGKLWASRLPLVAEHMPHCPVTLHLGPLPRPGGKAQLQATCEQSLQSASSLTLPCASWLTLPDVKSLEWLKPATGAVELCSDAVRFAARTDRFPFLAPDQLRDANKRRPDHPAYNPRTLYIPSDWFKKANVSEGQRQW